MNFKKWIDQNSNIDHIGKVAVFYLPYDKINQKTRKNIHDFLVDNYEAYTHEKGGMKGYWSDNKKITKDYHERFEVSFAGENNLKKLVNFLSDLCEKTKEKAIYLTVGGDSYIVKNN